MKKTLLTLLTLFLSTSIVNAESIKVGDSNYLIHDDLYCNGEKVSLLDANEYSKNILVYDSQFHSLLWKGDGNCTTSTPQYDLDVENASKRNLSCYGNVCTVKTYNFSFEEGYTKATGTFDENETYYILSNYSFHKETNPVASNFDTYYVKGYFRKPLDMTIDYNKTYYKIMPSTTSGYAVVDYDDIDVESMSDYYWLTTEDEINFKTQDYTMDLTTYNSLISGSYNDDFLEFKGKIYLQVLFGESSNYTSVKYYDINGVENTELRDYSEIFDFGDYLVYVSLDETVVTVNDSNDNLINTYTYTDPDEVYGAFYIAGNLILYAKIDNEMTSMVITKYELLEGNNQTFNNDDLVFRASGKYSDFKELKINGKVVPTDKYSVSEGSTIITLKKDYLSTLDAGNYNISIVYTDGGEALATFTIKLKENNIKEDNPNTFDTSYKFLLIGLVSILGIGIIYNKIKES